MFTLIFVSCAPTAIRIREISQQADQGYGGSRDGEEGGSGTEGSGDTAAETKTGITDGGSQQTTGANTGPQRIPGQNHSGAGSHEGEDCCAFVLLQWKLSLHPFLSFLFCFLRPLLMKLLFSSLFVKEPLTSCYPAFKTTSFGTFPFIPCG